MRFHHQSDDPTKRSRAASLLARGKGCGKLIFTQNLGPAPHSKVSLSARSFVWHSSGLLSGPVTFASGSSRWRIIKTHPFVGVLLVAFFRRLLRTESILCILFASPEENLGSLVLGRVLFGLVFLFISFARKRYEKHRKARQLLSLSGCPANCATVHCDWQRPSLPSWRSGFFSYRSRLPPLLLFCADICILYSYLSSFECFIASELRYRYL